MNKRNSNGTCKLYISTILFLFVFCIGFGLIVRIINLFQETNTEDTVNQFTIINTGEYSFKMYQYSQPREKFTSFLIDEDLKYFDIDTLDIPYDEVLYFHTSRELLDFKRFVQTDRTKLYILVSSEHEDLQQLIESWSDFTNIYDIKDRVQIFNCGNKSGNSSVVFVDEKLRIPPINIAYWNIGINPKKINTIKNTSVFSEYLSSDEFDYKNYDIYIFVSKDNEDLIKFCESICN